MGYVVAIGSSSLDHYYEAERWPALGDKAMVRSLGVKVGGLISNAACVMARCGLETYIIDIVSPDSEQLILGELQEYGVHTEQIMRRSDYVQSMTNIYIVGGEKSIFICKKKPQLFLSGEQYDLILGASAVYTTLPELRYINNYNEIIKKMKANGGRLVFDMETPVFSNTEEDRKLIAQADILFFNEMAMDKLCDGHKEEDVVEQLIGKGVEIVVVTRAEKGCSVYSHYGYLDAPGLQVKAVDTTGAGDTFNSVFLAAVLEGFSLERCAELANAGGARAVTMIGPKSGAADLHEIDAFLKMVKKQKGVDEK